MKKYLFSLLPVVLGVLFVVQNMSSFAVPDTSASTFVPCDPNDALCMLDCSLEGDVCGYYTDDGGGDDGNCEAGMYKNESGECVCSDSACCRVYYKDSFHNGSECECDPGATWNGSLCVLPDECPTGKTMSTTGNCVCTSNSCCEADFGKAVWDGNDVDGCTCAPGAAFNRETRQCFYCPDDQIVSNDGYCVCDNDTCCQNHLGDSYYDANTGCECLAGAEYSRNKAQCITCDDDKILNEIGNCVCTDDTCCQNDLGDAYYDGNDTDGCDCLAGATFDQVTRQCILEDSCPYGATRNENGNCACDNDNCCEAVFGDAYFDGNSVDGCTCYKGADVIDGICSLPGCPEGTVDDGSGDCMCASDSCCRDYYGSAVYDTDYENNCACVEGAELTNGVCVLDECPEGSIPHEGGGCICTADSCCKEEFGEYSKYDENSMDGCSCENEAEWDGEQCVVDMEIIVEPESFSIKADGSSEQEITAYVANAEGEKQAIEMWITLQTPNSIEPGKLSVSKGIEGKSHTEVQAIYTAPEISRDQKVEQQDEIKDLIYIFTIINGEKKYKVIEATLLTGEADIVITFEKPGFKTESKILTLDKSVILGEVYFMQEDKKYPINDVEVTVELAEKEDVSETTNTDKKGKFEMEFDKYEDKGEDTIDIEMKFAKEITKDLRNSKQYMAKTDRFDDFSAVEYIEDFTKTATKADSDDMENVIDGLKLSMNTLYLVGYYDVKAGESMDGFIGSSAGMFKDTASLVLGIIPLSEGITKIAKKVGGTKVGGMLYDAIPLKGDIGIKYRMIKSSLEPIINELYAVAKEYPQFFAELTVIIGAYQNKVTNDVLNVKVKVGKKDPTTNRRKQKEVTEILLDPMKSILIKEYIDEVDDTLGNYKIDIDNLPENLDENIKLSREIFKENTEKHTKRTNTQLDWDENIAWGTLITDIGKGAVKTYAIIQTGSFDPARFAAISEAVDAVGSGIDALKVGLDGSFVFDYIVIYLEDKDDLKRSLSALYTGVDSYAYNEQDVRKLYARYNGFELIPSAKAEAPEMVLSDVLINIANAVSEEDDENLEIYLGELEEIRESLFERSENERVEFIESLEANIASSGSDAKITDATIEILKENSKYALDSAMMDLHLAMLAADQSTESIENFVKTVDEFSEKETEYNSALKSYNRKALIAKSGIDFVLWGIVIVLVILLVILAITRNKWILLVFLFALLGSGIFYTVKYLDWSQFWHNDTVQNQENHV